MSNTAYEHINVLLETTTTTTPVPVMSWTAWVQWSPCQKQGVLVIKQRYRHYCDLYGSGCTDAEMENETCTIGK